MIIAGLLFGLLHLGPQASANTFTPLRPPAIPLAVRSPYLSTWQFAGSDGGNGGYLAGQWPTFWNGQITGWTGLISVDNSTYVWMGKPDGGYPLVTQTAFEYTSTKSIFTMNVHCKVAVTVTFLSPVEPLDLRSASLPYSYMNVDVSSMDGSAHNVSLYTDISAEWVSGDRGALVEWSYGSISSSPDIVYHSIWRQTQLEFTEIEEQTEYGYWYYATRSSAALTHQSGTDKDVRQQFADTGHLANTTDTHFRAINDSYPVFAYAISLDSLTATPQSTLFQLSLHQQDAIRFLGQGGLNQTLPSLWTSYFSNDQEALSFFYADYQSVSDYASTLDNKINTDSVAVGGANYSAITSLATRQAFASIAWANTSSNPLAFMKEISSDGNVNTVDVIFPFHPMALYLNPDLLVYLLNPLFTNQESGNWPKLYSIHDIGASFPNATGHPDGNAEDMPLEECGDMLIMTLAYAQRADDDEFLLEHYDLLKQWTQFLVNDSLVPANQISTDDFAGPLANQTNLAIKGIIGIEAFAQIANRTGNAVDAANYSSIAHSFITQWQSLGIAETSVLAHTTLAYGQNDTHGLLYNIYADAELGLDLVPKQVYDMQSTFYPTIANIYGVPLDTRHDYTKVDWEIFAAAVASPSTRSLLIDNIAKWLSQTTTNLPFTDLYSTNTGNFPPEPTFRNRPVVGGVYALLALSSAPAVKRQYRQQSDQQLINFQRPGVVRHPGTDLYNP